MKLIMIVLLTSLSASASYFMPKNNFKIPVGDFRANTEMNETTFNNVIDHIEEIYAPIVAKLGAKLVIERRWSDPTVNAYASRSGKTYKVAMFGGLARHKEATADGFAMVVCHEIGHHIGGSPRYSGDWASAEGQSDYWGTMNCGKRIFEKFDNMKYLVKRITKARIHAEKYGRKSAQSIADEFAIQKCGEVYTKNAQEAARCVRISMAGKSLARLLADLGGTAMPEFTTPNTSKVKRTNPKHPEAQCRLDTYFQGALCPVGYDTPIDGNDPFVGTCSRPAGHVVGVRPNCWFNEKDYL